MSIFALDYTLPALPIPTLKQTCSYLPDVVAPLVEPDVLDTTRAAIKEFQYPGGDGEKLQQALLQWGKRVHTPGNWLETLWKDQYARRRDPISLGMNYAVHFNTDRWGEGDALSKAVRALTRILTRLDKDEVEIERTRRGRALSMEQARRCTYTRIPGPEADSYRTVELFGWQRIAVTCRGHWFIVTLMDPDGNMPSENMLTKIFASIREETASLPQGAAVAAFTSGPRDKGANLRFLLQQKTPNRINFDAIEGSLFTVSLDPPLAPDELMPMRCLAGDASTRWFDKSLQLISTEDGQFGANFEHSQLDGSLWNHLLEQMDIMILRRNDEGIPAKSDAEKQKQPFYKLDWDIPESLEQKLNFASEDFARRVAAVDFTRNTYPEYGLESLLSLRTNPDVFFQIAIQVAQYKVFGKFRSSYEAISMRGFCQGRTTRVRPCTSAALDFCHALEAGEDHKTLASLYRHAKAAHLKAVGRSLSGNDFERHMLGLQTMHAFYGNELGITHTPALFQDPGWLTVQDDVLFTSTIKGQEYLATAVATHTHEEGYGVFYVIKDEKAVMLVSAFEGAQHSASEFMCAFQEAAAAMLDMLQAEIGNIP